MTALRFPLGEIGSHLCLLKTIILIELVMELSIQTSPLNYHFFNLLYYLMAFFIKNSFNCVYTQPSHSCIHF